MKVSNDVKMFAVLSMLADDYDNTFECKDAQKACQWAVDFISKIPAPADNAEAAVN